LVDCAEEMLRVSGLVLLQPSNRLNKHEDAHL